MRKILNLKEFEGHDALIDKFVDVNMPDSARHVQVQVKHTGLSNNKSEISILETSSSDMIEVFKSSTQEAVLSLDSGTGSDILKILVPIISSKIRILYTSDNTSGTIEKVVVTLL